MRMNTPEDFFLTPTFDEFNPINSIRGLNFVCGFETSDRDKYRHFAKRKVPTEFRAVLLGSLKKISNLLSKKRDIYGFLETYGKVSAVSAVDFFKRPIIKSYGSIGRSADPKKALAQFREIAWPTFVRSYDYLDIAGLLYKSVPPKKGQEITKEIMNKAQPKDVIKLYRLVSRAEEDLVPYLGEIMKKNVRIEIHNASTGFLEKTTRHEIELLSPIPAQHRGLLSELRRLFRRDYIESRKKYLSSLGTSTDPIYCIRVEKDLKLNTDPHYLGNLITRFNNLCGFVDLFQKRRIDLEKEERLRIYEYKHDASFRGTVVYDKKEEFMKRGIFVVMLNGGPGRLCVIHPFSDESTKIDVEQSIRTLEKRKIAYEKNNDVLESLHESREMIKEIAEDIKGKALNDTEEEKWHSELKEKILRIRISKRMVIPRDLNELKNSLYRLYFRLPSTEEIDETIRR
jgi:hypothetical protein